MVLLLLAFMPAKAQDQFIIDMSEQEALDAFLSVSQPSRVGELAVGERGFLNPQVICRDGDSLGISAAAILRDAPGRYGLRLEVQRLPGHQISVRTLVGFDNHGYIAEDILRVVWSILGANPRFNYSDKNCEAIRSAFPDAQILTVSSVDGYYSVSDWVEALLTGSHTLSRRAGWQR